MPRLAYIAITLAALAGLLAGPWLAYAAGARGAAGFENRAAADWPALGPADWARSIDPGGAYEPWLVDRLPGRETAIQTWNRLILGVFDDSPSDLVRMGREDWLFLSLAVNPQRCRDEPTLRRRATLTRRALETVEAAGKTGLAVVSPDKARHFPDYLRARNARVWERCAEPEIADLRLALADQPVLFVSDAFDQALSGTRCETPEDFATGACLYQPRDRHWNAEGGRIQAAAIARALDAAGVDPDAFIPRTLPMAPKSAELGLRGFNLELSEVTQNQVLLARDIPCHHTGGRIPWMRERAFSVCPQAPDPRTVLVIHDSFLDDSAVYLNARFQRLAMIHWSDIRRARGFFERAYGEADIVILQSVESIPRYQHWANFIQAAERAAGSAESGT